MSPQVGHNGEVTTATFGLTSVGFLPGVAVHVGLKRAGASEALVADLALVLLLRTRRDLGVELTHHRLWRWQCVVTDQARRSG